MKLIPQRGKYDCGVACLAMVLESTYEYAETMLGRNVNEEHKDLDLDFPIVGIFEEEFIGILFREGLKPIYWRSHLTEGENTNWFEKGFDRFPSCINLLDVCEYIDNGGVAIVGVESLCTEYHHWIVFDGQKILDPSTSLIYEYGDKFNAHSAILIGERR